MASRTYPCAAYSNTPRSLVLNHIFIGFFPFHASNGLLTEFIFLIPNGLLLASLLQLLLPLLEFLRLVVEGSFYWLDLIPEILQFLGNLFETDLQARVEKFRIETCSRAYTFAMGR